MTTASASESGRSRGGYVESAAPYRKRNFLAMGLDGGFYLGGMAFVASDTLLPNMVHSLGGPTWLVSFTPVTMILGFMVAPLMAAHWIERQVKMKEICLTTGIPQRVAFLLAAVALLFLYPYAPMTALYLAAFAPLLSGIAGGFGMPAFYELFSRIMPPERRSSLNAFRNIAGGLVALIAGWTIHLLLNRHPGADGYGMLFLIAFFVTCLSWFSFAAIREIPAPERQQLQAVSLGKSLREIPGILKKDRSLRLMAAARFLGTSLFILMPFLAVQATEVTGRGDRFVGLLVTARTIGLLSGNVVAGWLGDVYGGRLPLIVSRVLLLMVCVAAPLAQSAFSFMAIYFLFGMGFTMTLIGGSTLSLEISPDGRRPTYIAVLATASMPGFIAAPLLGTLVRSLTDSLLPLALIAGIGTLATLVVTCFLPEPRGQK